jgi:circadian clock protein KaiC
MDRISTGNAQADLILRGGFPAHSINIIMGQPGSGKTVFSEQLAFSNLGERPVLYLTTVSEPLPKVLTYLQEFDFADVNAIGSRIIYESIADTVTVDPQRLPERVTELLKQYRPRILIFDSFKAVADLMPDLAAWRKVLYELASTLSAYDATTFWIGEYVADMVARLPEFAVADAIIELTREQSGTRDDRFLHVIKLRGSTFLDGFHAFRIGRGGLEIFPRLVSPVAFGSGYATRTERLATGIRGLDDMIETGWLRGTSTLVIGPSGSGKTLLGLHFLREGVRGREPGLLVTFQENPTQLARVFNTLGWKTEEISRASGLDVLYTSPVELQIDTIVGEIFRRIDAHRVRRVVIDALGDLIGASRDTRRFRDYAYALTQRFAAQGVTAMLTVEVARGGDLPVDVAPMVDNILLLETFLDGAGHRTIRIVKTRGSGYDPRRYPLRITPKGVVVDRTSKRA